MGQHLGINQKLCLEIKASEPYSDTYLLVKLGESYKFEVSPKDNWTDWFIKTNADGFKNWFRREKYKRVPDQKCFKLCGTIEANENGHFPIGTNYRW